VEIGKKTYQKDAWHLVLLETYLGAISSMPFIDMENLTGEPDKEVIKIRSRQHEHTSQCDGPAWLTRERGAMNSWFPFIDGVSLPTTSRGSTRGGNLTEEEQGEEYQIEPDPAAELEETQEFESQNDNYNESEDPTVPTVTDEEEESILVAITRMSMRTITKPSRDNANPMKKIEHKHVILHQPESDHERYIEYAADIVVVAARAINAITHAASQRGSGFAQQYILQKGLKKHGKKGKQAAIEEIDQLRHRNCFNPIDISMLTPSEKKKAKWSLLFLTEKRDGRTKGRLVYNANQPGSGCRRTTPHPRPRHSNASFSHQSCM
jgi:hypothetical protein